MIKTVFNYISDDWKRVKNHCRTTDNKDFTDNEASEIFKKKLLISEHSPIRLLEFDWSWKSMKYWVSTEWSRHKFEKFISTERDDRPFEKQNEVVTVWDELTQKEITYKPKTRDDKPQKQPVTYDGYSNMQSCIDVWRKRLCFQATTDARLCGESFKLELHKTHKNEADVLVPNCIYRCGCPEFKPCSFWDSFVENFPKNKEITNIQDRYDVYNKIFYNEVD